MELYLVVGERGVTDLAPGVYHYLVAEHALEPVVKGDFRAAVAKACNSQAWMTEAPVMVVIAGEYRRSAVKNGEQGAYVHPHGVRFRGPKIFLQAEALGLGAGIVGAFKDKGLGQALKLPQERRAAAGDAGGV